MHRKTTIIGTVLYAVLAALALIFYQERTAFLDIAFHLFYLLKDGDFAIQNNRFIALFTQTIPLAGARIGLGLKSIMQLYSVGFVCFYAAVFFILVRVFKSHRLGIAMLLFSTLMVSHTFYWIQSELPQGLAMLILYFGFLEYSSKNESAVYTWWYLPAFSLFQFFIVFAHPLIIIAYLFLALYYLTHNKTTRKLQASSLIAFLGFFLIKYLFFKTQYDSNAMEGAKSFIKSFPHNLPLAAYGKIVLQLFKDYYLFTVGFAALLGLYLFEKKYLKLILLGLFTAGYLLLIQISFPSGIKQFYLENLYLPIALFVIFPLIFDGFARLSEKVLVGTLATILILGVLNIYLGHQRYTDRVAYLNKYIQRTAKLEQRKLILPDSSVSTDTLIMTWATPYEVWLLSTINTGQTRSIIITDNIQELEWTLPYNKKFVTKWGAFDYAELPDSYFVLRDTTFYKIER